MLCLTLLRASLVVTVFFIYGALSDIELVPREEKTERYVNASYIVTCMGEGTQRTTWIGPNGHPIQANTGRIHVEEGRTDTGIQSVLVFERIERLDRGNYTCQAYVKGQLQRASFTLLVVKPIMFHGQLEHQKLIEGQSMTVRCEVTGDPPPQVFWQIKDKPLKESTGRHQQLPLGLHISNVTRQDEGMYKCRAFQLTSKNSNLQVQNILVTVDQKPRWPEGALRAPNVYGYPSGEANITCKALGKPPPGYAWYRHNKTLDPSYTTVFQENGFSVLQVKMKNMNVVLGEYQCLAENPVGAIMRRFVLLEGRKPSPPSRLAVLNVGPYTAYVDADPPNDNDRDNILGYRMLFAQENPSGDAIWDQADYQDVYTEGGEPYKIYDLSPNQGYALRAATRTEAGLSDWSYQVTFRTPPSAASALQSPFLTVLFVITFMGLRDLHLRS